jgi:Mg2+-importing ATPase
MLSMAGAVFFLPFLPMLPTQLLVNNFLYDLAQITIPTDNVDPAYIRNPQRWDISVIQKFMLLIGPLSSFFRLHYLRDPALRVSLWGVTVPDRLVY